MYNVLLNDFDKVCPRFPMYTIYTSTHMTGDNFEWD